MQTQLIELITEMFWTCDILFSPLADLNIKISTCEPLAVEVMCEYTSIYGASSGQIHVCESVGKTGEKGAGESPPPEKT